MGVVSRIEDRLDGPENARIVLLLGAVLALNSADSGVIGAVAVDLERSLHIGNTELGLLVTVSSLVGAAAAVPVGHLVDRVPRVRLLGVSIVLWAVAQAVSGLSTSFLMLLITRVALGGVTATAGPAVASLTGDYFPAAKRSRMYGYILAGELAGTGFGVLVGGSLAGPLGWRAGVIVLAIPSLAMAWLLPRTLREPARGGQLHAGDTKADRSAAVMPFPSGRGKARQRDVGRLISAAGSLWDAIKYVISVRTNVAMILASSLGYFFFSGLRTFLIIFARSQYHLSQGVAVAAVLFLGAFSMVGLLVGGRLADMLLRRGRKDARLMVAGVAYIAAAFAILPGLLSTSLLIAIPVFMAASFALSAPNPPLDAARLDVVPSGLWGRAEGVRTLLRNVMEAFAPLLFGLLSAQLSGSRPATAEAGNKVLTAAQARGLQRTFIVMLVPLVVSGVILLWARRLYPQDVERARRAEGSTDVAGEP